MHAAAHTLGQQEHAMNSLRAVVERWLSHMQATQVSFARFGCDEWGRRRHIRLDIHRPDGDVAIHFFRHCDGMWRVFPPAPTRLSMRAFRVGDD
jgi:hypothetical protein